ncbi:helix-turn-helix domain-containing protein [Nesterenkonia ebinurensis]|uniref:helix-turn-helix domain-containing protein n=1 Tax=Nesterenkonia ebinurensis TaxID=2608252 RepID=UPI00123D6784|nr:helix-turn-helix domain-containing protein [Nesterenkonia ebinurensis]
MTTEQQKVTPDDNAIGRRIRALRQRRGLTLVQLAKQADLSHPFLSQIERGHAHPSLSSLERICRALGVGRLELIVAASDVSEEGGTSDRVVRAKRGVESSSDSFQEESGRSLLLHGRAAFHVMRLTVDNPQFLDYFHHPEAEFVYIIAGWLEVDLEDNEVYFLEANDSLYYPGDQGHRWRCVGGKPCELLMVKEPPAFLD